MTFQLLPLATSCLNSTMACSWAMTLAWAKATFRLWPDCDSICDASASCCVLGADGIETPSPAAICRSAASAEVWSLTYLAATPSSGSATLSSTFLLIDSSAMLAWAAAAMNARSWFDSVDVSGRPVAPCAGAATAAAVTSPAESAKQAAARPRASLVPGPRLPP